MTRTAISPRLAISTLVSTKGQSVIVIVDGRTRAHIARCTRFADIREFASIGSTNTYLLEEARAGAPEGTVAVADHQTAGRGRLGRTWVAPPGASLLVSVLLRPVQVPTDRRHLLTAAVALAAAGACGAVAAIFPMIKWPNDLLVEDRKLAGILAEADRDAVVVGMGLNVASAPPEGVSLDEVAGRPIARGDLLAATLERLESWYRDMSGVAAAYRSACGTVGRQVRVELPGGRADGAGRGSGRPWPSPGPHRRGQGGGHLRRRRDPRAALVASAYGLRPLRGPGVVPKGRQGVRRGGNRASRRSMGPRPYLSGGRHPGHG